jgi:hypothetical protein
MSNYKKALMGYAAQIETLNDAGHKMLMSEVQHDSWCKLLKGKGDCNCDSNIVLKVWNGTSFDKAFRQ